VRVVAVLDPNVLIPPGLRDMLLSCAHVGVFRPVSQKEILDEVYRNSIRIAVTKRGMTEQQAIVGVKHALTQMRRAFPDACAETKLWAPPVPHVTCDEKDRHVLAIAVGTTATFWSPPTSTTSQSAPAQRGWRGHRGPVSA
jgi:hypothetical protein